MQWRELFIQRFLLKHRLFFRCQKFQRKEFVWKVTSRKLTSTFIAPQLLSGFFRLLLSSKHSLEVRQLLQFLLHLSVCSCQFFFFTHCNLGSVCYTSDHGLWLQCFLLESILNETVPKSYLQLYANDVSTSWNWLWKANILTNVFLSFCSLVVDYLAHVFDVLKTDLKDDLVSWPSKQALQYLGVNRTKMQRPAGGFLRAGENPNKLKW